MYTLEKDITAVFIASNIRDDVAAFDTYAKTNILNYAGCSYSSTMPNVVQFSFNGQPQESNENSLDAALDAHYTASVDLLRKNRIKAVDANTAKLIYQPATFDGHTFSMSDVAQRNWIAVKSSIDIYTALNLWPVGVTCEPDDEYLLTDPVHATHFATAMLMSAAVKYNSGRAIKMALRAATTKAEIDAIVDNR